MKKYQEVAVSRTITPQALKSFNDEHIYTLLFSHRVLDRQQGQLLLMALKFPLCPQKQGKDYSIQIPGDRSVYSIRNPSKDTKLHNLISLLEHLVEGVGFFCNKMWMCSTKEKGAQMRYL
jgi:hypothetical protein